MKRTPLLRYGIAVLAVGLALLLKLLLDPLIVQETPFLLVLAAVMVSAWYGGLRAGLLGTALATLVVGYFFLYPVDSFAGLSLKAVPLALFMLEGLLISGVVAALSSAKQRAEASALEAQKHQEGVRRSEERFRSLVQNTSDIIAVVDAQGTVSYVSPAVEQVLGYRPEEMIGKSAFDFVYPDEREEALGIFAQVSSEPGVHPPFECRVLHKDGSWRYLEHIANNLLDDPSVRGVVVNQRDITERKRAEEVRARLAAIVESSSDAIIGKTLEGTITNWNRGAQKIYGYSAEEVVGKPIHILVPPDRPDEIPRILQRLRRGESIEHYETVRVTKDGRRLDISLTISPIRDSSGNIVGAATVARDVTERKQAEERLRRSLDSLLALYEAGQILGSTLERKEIGSNLLQIMQRVSRLDAAVINLRDEREQLCIWHTLGPESLWRWAQNTPEAQVACRKVLETEEHQLFKLQRPSPDKRSLVGLCVPLRVRDQLTGVLEAYGPEALGEKETVETLVSLTSQAASALENARLYEELAERERQLRDLVRRLFVAQEEERRRIAYDIHDGAIQVAVATHQHLQAFADDYPPSSAQGQKQLRWCLKLAQQAIREARRVIAGLRPTTLDDFGLASAIDSLVEELVSEGWEVSYEDTLGDERLPVVVETGLFRVAQEALTNVRKHAQTTRVDVALQRLEGAVRLQVKDWGRGFQPDEVTDEGGPGERVGLSSMQERISLLDGSFEIHSEPGAGTSIAVDVPLPASEEETNHAN